MSVTPNYVPREYKTVNLQLVVKNAHEALKFYNNAFAAEIAAAAVLRHGRDLPQALDELVLGLRRPVVRVREPRAARVERAWAGAPPRRRALHASGVDIRNALISCSGLSLACGP